MQQQNLITKLKQNRATTPVLIISILLLILGVSLGILFYKGKNEIVTTTVNHTDVARDDMIAELNNLLSYLGELDRSVIENQNTLGTVADYSSTYQSKISNVKTSIHELETTINNYLTNNEIPDENIRNCLEEILDGLKNTSNMLTKNENTFLSLIEEYKTANDERRKEIEAELEKIYNNLYKEFESVGSIYENLQKIHSSSQGTDNELKNFLSTLEIKFNRLINTKFSSLLSLLDKGTINLSLKVDQGIDSLTKKMISLHTTVSESQANISELLADMSNTDANSQETINQEFYTVKANIESLNTSFHAAHSEVKALLKVLTKDMESLFDDQNELLEKSFKEHNLHLDESFEEHNTHLDESFEEHNLHLAEKFNEHDTNMSNSFTEQNTYLKNSFSNQELHFDQSMENQTRHIDELYDQLKTILEKMSSDMEHLLTEQFEEMMSTLSSMENNYLEALENYHIKTIDNLTTLNTNISHQFQNIDSNINNQYQNLTNIVNTGDSELKTYLDSIYGNLSQRLDQVFTYVSNGKKLLASALLTKGVSCEEDATFAKIYNAILSIKQTLVIGVERLPGTIAYDYHYHTDVNGTMLHTATCSIAQKGGCYISPVYHVHTGSSGSGGGCYTVANTGYNTIGCGGGDAINGPHGPDSSGNYYWVGNCNNCGGAVSNYGGPGWAACGNTSVVPYTYYTLGCGMGPTTIVAYQPACGLADGQMVGAHIVYEPAYTTGYNGTAQAMSYSLNKFVDTVTTEENSVIKSDNPETLATDNGEIIPESSPTVSGNSAESPIVPEETTSVSSNETNNLQTKDDNTTTSTLSEEHEASLEMSSPEITIEENTVASAPISNTTISENSTETETLSTVNEINNLP